MRSSDDTVCLYPQSSNMSESSRLDNSDSDSSNKPETEASSDMCKRVPESADFNKSDNSEIEAVSKMDERTSENSKTSKRPEKDTPIQQIALKKSTVRRILKHHTQKKILKLEDEGQSGRVQRSSVELSKRKSWFSETNLLINCIGFTVGIGNIWRFPYMAFKNGGGTFLIPYLLLTILISLPLYYMELFLGQYSGLDPVRVWSFCPFFKGLGITVLLCIIVIHSYYNIIMAYALYYLAHTFRVVLPWSICSSSATNCYDISGNFSACQPFNFSSTLEDNCQKGLESSADQFWKYYVLGISSGLDDPRIIKWDIAIALFVSWVIVCALVISRYHTEYQMKFKTVYVTAFFPFVVLAAYFGYVAFLKGAGKGLTKMFVPDWQALLDVSVWSQAAEASLFSAGLGVGGLIIFGSKNELHYNIQRCAVISTFVDAMTSLFAGCIVFMVVGSLSQQRNVEFTEATLYGPGLVFITFPHAAEYMGQPHIWSFLFFLMLFSLAVDTSVAMTEALSSGLKLLCSPAHPNTKIFVVLTCTMLYVTGLPCATHSGAFLVKLLDWYGAGHCLMGTVLLECVAFGWGYGLNNISKNYETIHGTSPSLYLQICLVIIAPFATIALFIYTIIYSELTPLFDIPYPPYANAIGWGIVTVVLLPVPICMFIVLVQFRKNWRKAFVPATTWRKNVRRRKSDAIL